MAAGLRSGSLSLALTALVACAEPPSASDVKITGGTLVDAEDPVAASTVVVYGEDLPRFAMLCSGTLIGARTVLTAAHCVGRAPSIYHVVFGTDRETGERRRVTAVKRHESFDAANPTQGHDIAVLRLAEDAPATAVPARLGDVPTLTTNDRVILAGYGVTRPDATPATNDAGVLRKTTSRVARNVAGGMVLFDSYSESNACAGDSGGPAYAAGAPAGEPLTVIGVSTHTVEIPHVEGCESGLSVYVKVAAYLDWIARSDAALATSDQ